MEQKPIDILKASISEAKEAASDLANMSADITEAGTDEARSKLVSIYRLATLAHEHKKEFAKLAADTKKPKAGTDNAVCYFIVKFAFHKMGQFSAATMKRYAQAIRLGVDFNLSPSDFDGILQKERISGLSKRYAKLYQRPAAKKKADAYDYWFRHNPPITTIQEHPDLIGNSEGALGFIIYRRKKDTLEILTGVHLNEATTRRLMARYCPKPQAKKSS